jgi:hypothetical protein
MSRPNGCYGTCVPGPIGASRAGCRAPTRALWHQRASSTGSRHSLAIADSAVHPPAGTVARRRHVPRWAHRFAGRGRCGRGGGRLQRLVRIPSRGSRPSARSRRAGGGGRGGGGGGGGGGGRGGGGGGGGGGGPPRPRPPSAATGPCTRSGSRTWSPATSSCSVRATASRPTAASSPEPSTSTCRCSPANPTRSLDQRRLEVPRSDGRLASRRRRFRIR